MIGPEVSEHFFRSVTMVKLRLENLWYEEMLFNTSIGPLIKIHFAGSSH
jgi:hypothetical protein